MHPQPHRNGRLGEQMTRLVRSLAALKGWTMSRATKEVGDHTGYGPDMVYRWKQGRSCPPPEAMDILLHLGREEARLDREWGESFLRAAHYPDPSSAVNDLWGPKEIRHIPCNLPPPEHTELIGREKEFAFLLELLSARYAAHLITVDGIGGVGKTALVLEVAYRCLEASTGERPDLKVPTFDAIIFVSAKQTYLTPDGILSRFGAQRTLRDIFREVAQTLGRYDITHAEPQDQPDRVQEALARQHTLLIVDNVETMEDKQEIMSFLFSLPPSVKAVITTRERAMFSPVRLEQLGKEEAFNLIRNEAREKGTGVGREQALVLYQRIGGIPAALVYAIGQIAYGYAVEGVLSRIVQATSDVARFCFEVSVGSLKGQPAYYLLMALAMFPKYPLRTAIASVAGLNGDPMAVEDALAKLQRLSLVSQQEGRYKMLQLTREYALAELARDAEFERAARKRWVEWYLNFTNDYGGNDWKEWHIQYDQVEEEWENLLAVFDWCAAHELYNEMRAFWQGGGVCQFAHVYGYWDDKLTWLTWIIRAAERRGDWSTAVEARKDKGYTLILMGKIEESNEHFARAWDLHQYAEPRVQVYLAQELAANRVFQKRFTEAPGWLNEAETLMSAFELGEPEDTRMRINGQRYYGVLHYEEQNYNQAEKYFQEVVERSQAIGWQRATFYAQDYLANIAIVKGRFDEAERLAHQGLTVSKRNKDKRRIASYKRTIARLHRMRGNLDEARNWAQEAHEDYERLGMHLEVEEMELVLQQLYA